MQNLEWDKIKEVFNQVCDLPIGERDTLLNNYNDFVQKEVRNLLEWDELADSFIVEPAAVELGFSRDLNIGQIIDDYKIVALIGEGGMGNVYLAERVGFEQKVALKLIKRGMDTRAVLKRFKTERQILSRLNHPNIAKLLDGGETPNGVPYFVMEYIEGLPITKFCDEHRFDVNERLELFQKVCEAITYAHANLIVHRDIKPSNIIVTDDGTPKLLDFGIAKLLDNENEKTVTIGRMFTPEYASPEQINGQPITTATDIYSLGVVLYQLLSGVRPFNSKSKNYSEISNLILTEEPQKPSSVVRNTSRNNDQTDSEFINPTSKIQHPKSLKGDLDNIILKSLRKEPELRYQSVGDFSEDVKRHLKGLPVTATADSTRYRLSKFIQRHKQGVFLGSFVSLLIFSLSGFSIYQTFIANQERVKAEKRLNEIRSLAKSLMNETRDSLDYVPGTINLRQSLSEKSVNLLDSIYDENITDANHLKELADSYEKLARTQIWEFRDVENAVNTCRKAIDIRHKTIQLENNLIRKIELANSLSTLAEFYYLKKDGEALIRVNDELEILRREIVRDDSTPQNISELAQHLIGFVGTFKEFETITDNETKLKEADGLLRQIIEELKNKSLGPNEQTELVWNVICLGLVNRKLNANETALQYFKQAVATAENAYQADNSLQLAFNYADFSRRQIGEILFEKGDYKAALEIYSANLNWLKLRENNNAQSKPNLAWRMSNSANRTALALQKSGRKEEAEKIIVQPWQDYSAFLKNESNAASVVYAEEPLSYLAKYYADANQPEKAIEIWQTQIDRVQKFLDKNSDDIRFMQFQAAAFAEIGNIHSGYDEKSKSFKTKDQNQLQKAKSAYQKSVEFHRKSQSLYKPTQTEKDHLSGTEAKISKLP